MAGRGVYSAEVMERIVNEAIAEGNVALVARRYGVTRQAVAGWIKARAEGKTTGSTLSAAAVDQVLVENRELKRLLGDKQLRIDILEALLKKTAQRGEIKRK